MTTSLASLHPPQLTVVVLAYLPSMNYRVEKLVCDYARVRSVAKILVVWNGSPDVELPNATCAMRWSQKSNSHHALLPRRFRGIKPVKLEIVVEARNTLLNRYRQAL